MTTPIQRTFITLCCVVTILIQSACLRDSYLVKISDSVLTSEGDVINPDIEIIDQYGNPFVFGYSGSRGMLNSKKSPVYGLRENELPRDREYTLIRMKSATPIKCNAVYWFSESSKDLK